MERVCRFGVNFDGIWSVLVRGVTLNPDEDEQDNDLAVLHEFGQKKHTLMEELRVSSFLVLVELFLAHSELCLPHTGSCWLIFNNI
jgi:hypothetical protein